MTLSPPPFLELAGGHDDSDDDHHLQHHLHLDNQPQEPTLSSKCGEDDSLEPGKLYNNSKPEIFRPELPSNLMERLSTFIPKIKKANAELVSKDPKIYNIEMDDDGDNDNDQVIELNLGLGVFEETCSNNGEGEETTTNQNELSTLKLPNQPMEKRRKRPLVVVVEKNDGGIHSNDHPLLVKSFDSKEEAFTLNDKLDKANLNADSNSHNNNNNRST